MKIRNYIPLVLVVAVAGCAEQPLGLGLERSSALFHHAPPEWASSSFGLHDVADLAAVANGSDVTLTWTSEDNYTDADFFAPVNGDPLTKWHFEVYRRDNGAAVPAFAKLEDTSACSWDAGTSTLECEYVDSGVADGSYTYRVKAFAREGSPPNHEIHHSHDSNPADVVVGGLFAFEVQYRVGSSELSNSQKFNRNGGTWNYSFVLSVLNPVTNVMEPVTDCTTYPLAAIALQGVWTAPSAANKTGAVTECEVVGSFNPARAVYRATIDNGLQQNSQDTAGTFVFTIAGTINQNTVSFQGVHASQVN